MGSFKDSAIPSLIGSLLLGALALAIRFLGVSEQVSVLIATVVAIVSLAIFMLIYRPVMRRASLSFVKSELKLQDERAKKFKEKFTKMVEETGVGTDTRSAGIVKRYNSFRACEDVIAERMKKAQTVKLFTNVGKSDLSKGNRFYDAMILNRNADIKVLIAAECSPYISEEWAHSHNFSGDQVQQWVSRLHEVVREIRYLNNHHKISVKVKGHQLPFVWHFWIIDNHAFISAFLERSRSFDNVQVIEVEKPTPESGKGLYDIFQGFFDRIWEEQSNDFDEKL